MSNTHQCQILGPPPSFCYVGFASARLRNCIVNNSGFFSWHETTSCWTLFNLITCKSVIFVARTWINELRYLGQIVHELCRCHWALIFFSRSTIVDDFLDQLMDLGTRLEQATVHLWSKCRKNRQSHQTWLLSVLMFGDSPTHFAYLICSWHVPSNGGWVEGFSWPYLFKQTGGFGFLSDGGWQLEVGTYLLIPQITQWQGQ